MSRVLEIFGLGACLLHGPLGAAMREKEVRSSFSRIPGATMPSVYCVDDAVQLIRFLKGEMDIPAVLRQFCAITPELAPDGPAGTLPQGDVAIIEVNSPIRIAYRDYSLGRTDLMDRIFAPLRDRGPEVGRAIDAWYYKGLMSTDDSARKAASEILLGAVADDMQDAELVRSILAEAYGYARDGRELTAGIATLREMLGLPLGMMTYTHQYLPDGRPMPWPPEFVEQQIEAASELGIPYFQPSRVVKQYGVARALQEDRVHYQDQFQSVMGDVLIQFAGAVCGGSLGRD